MPLFYIIALCLASALFIGLYVELLRELAPRNISTLIPHPTLVGAITASIILILLLCFRSLEFGVDTVVYAELFSHYCSGSSLNDEGRSFQVAMHTLNAFMLGACSTSLLPASWVFAIVMLVLFMPVSWLLRISYLAAFLLSIIGIELTTNAMRQGFSVCFMLLCISFLTTQIGLRRWLALPFAFAALLFHDSAALFLVAFLIALLPWHLFLGTSIVIVFFIVISLDKGLNLPLVSDLIYEIQKYAAHDNDELWIRVLSFATVLAALVAPLLASNNKSLPLKLVNGPYAIAARLSLLCLPSLVLPYFGYRFIYGLYPIILFLTLCSSMLPKASPLERPYVHFLWLTAMNSLVLLIWSAGSRFMREVPFL